MTIDDPALESGGRIIRAAMLLRVTPLAVAIALLAAMLLTLYEKNVVYTVSQQGWGRLQYGIAAALTKERFGVGGFAIDDRIFAEMSREGYSVVNLDDPAALEHALYQAAEFPGKVEDAPSADGNYPHLMGFYGEDLGLAIYCSIAFKLFGLHIASISYLYFAIIFFTLVLYTSAHGRNAAALIAAALLIAGLYFVACSRIVHFAPNGTDLKDPRFLSTLAALPILHLVLMWLKRDARLTPADYVVLSSQSVVFAFALSLRSSTIWAVLALVPLWCVFTVLAARYSKSWRVLLDWRSSRCIFTLASVLAIVFGAQLLIRESLHPVYDRMGDVPHHTFWQGVLSSLQLDEAVWKSKYGAWASGAEGDAMPAMIARNAIMHLPPDERAKYLYNGEVVKRTALEKFSREAFFKILRDDPKFVVHTFFYLKPMRMTRSVGLFAASLFTGLPAWSWIVASVALLVLIGVAASDAAATSVLGSIALTSCWFLLVAWLPNWLIALNPLVMIDNFLWDMMALGAATILSLAVLVRALWRRLSPDRPVQPSVAVSPPEHASSPNVS